MTMIIQAELRLNSKQGLVQYIETIKLESLLEFRRQELASIALQF